MELTPEFQTNPQSNVVPPTHLPMSGSSEPPKDPPSNELPPDDFEVLLEAFSPDQPASEEPGEKMDIVTSPARPRSFLQVVSDVARQILSPARPASDAKIGGSQERPKRNVSRPHLYQSEEEAEREKDQRRKG